MNPRNLSSELKLTHPSTPPTHTHTPLPNNNELQANMQKLAKVSEAFDGVRKDEKKRKYRAQGKEEERVKRARSGGGRGGGKGGRSKGGGGDDD